MALCQAARIERFSVAKCKTNPMLRTEYNGVGVVFNRKHVIEIVRNIEADLLD